MGISDLLPGQGHDCTGRYGRIEEDGQVTKGIELQCSNYDAKRVFQGDKPEAERKAEDWLEQEDLTARVTDET